jgi:hypothetical protein
MYKKRLLSSLATGDITVLQQKALQQEFIAVVEKAGFILYECSRQNIVCRYKKSENVFLSLVTDQNLRQESETPGTQVWGNWCLCDRERRPLQLPGNKSSGEARSCTGFWQEGTGDITPFINDYLRNLS